MLEKIKKIWSKLPKKYQDITKEVGRWFIIGFFSLLVQGENIDRAVIQTLCLRIIDRTLHLYAKDHEVTWLITGLTRF